MARIILVTGGCRSGKSEYAQGLGESMPGPRVFVATCPPVDEEMARRIQKHQEARNQGVWQTIEEETRLAEILNSAGDFRVVLVDCLSLWVANLMSEAEKFRRTLSEEDTALRCRELVDACTALDAAVIFVTSEVGMGIVPSNGAARLFRDLLGKVNQMIADSADEVTLVACGLPLHLKKGTSV